ncbi:MAG: hypothetical protein M3044_18160 [Thermoproteota archaeon]|nr:hypothetical protein [Thermoproteota archaeon]
MRREKIRALSLAKGCYGMKLDLLTNATVVDDAIRFVLEHGKSTTTVLSEAGTDAAEAIKPKTNTVEYIQETDSTRQQSSNIMPTNQVF